VWKAVVGLSSAGRIFISCMECESLAQKRLFYLRHARNSWMPVCLKGVMPVMLVFARSGSSLEHPSQHVEVYRCMSFELLILFPFRVSRTQHVAHSHEMVALLLILAPMDSTE